MSLLQLLLFHLVIIGSCVVVLLFGITILLYFRDHFSGGYLSFRPFKLVHLIRHLMM